MKTIAIDMDEVIADVMPKFHDLFERQFGYRVPEHELVGKKIYDVPGAIEVREAIFEKGFFKDLPFIPGAKDGLMFLRKHYEIYLVTAAMEFRNSFEDKYDWIAEHLPWVSWRNIVFCGDKSIIGTDYLIDDHAKNLETFRGKPLLFDALHNRNEHRFERMKNWQAVQEFFERELSKES